MKPTKCSFKRGEEAGELREYNRGGEPVQSTLYVCTYEIITMKPLVLLMYVNLEHKF
jgi:hypothetical protein